MGWPQKVRPRLKVGLLTSKDQDSGWGFPLQIIQQRALTRRCSQPRRFPLTPDGVKRTTKNSHHALTVQLRGSPGFKTKGMLRREHTEKQRGKKVTSYVDRDKGQSEAERAVRRHLQEEERKMLPRVYQRSMAHGRFRFELLASRTERGSFSVLLSHLVCACLLWQS